MAARDASWSLVHESIAQATNGVRRRRGEFDEHVDSDTGVCTMEVALAPQATVTRAVADARTVMRDLQGHLGDRGYTLLSAGIQPITWFDTRRKTRRDWYVLLSRRWHLHHWMIPLASQQISVDVSPSEAARVVNMLCGLAGVFTALTASSPIARGALAPWKETRNWIWHHRAARVPPADARYTSNALPPRPFRDLGDYIEFAWNSTMYLLTDLKSRGYEVLGDRSFRDFVLADGAAVPARGWDGQRLLLSPTRAMLDSIHQYGWLAAKLHYCFDQHTTLTDVRDALRHGQIGSYCEQHLVRTYVENRSCGVAPFGEEGTAPALTLGLIEMLDDVELLMRELSWEQWRRLWLRASEHGLDLETERMLSTIRRLLELAHAGLCRRGAAEEALLDPLFERLDARRVPADRMIATFSRGGVPAVVEQFGLANR
jgi:gamma-glutamylcysteine synthetase